MSEFHVRVVRLGAIQKHPGADSLSITDVQGYPCILRTGELHEGDLAVYLPVDSIVPAGDPRWAFLGENRRIKAKRLRGIFSMGLLTTAEPTWKEGDDVRALLGIEKHDPEAQASAAGDENEPDPSFFPAYTDIEGLRRWPDALAAGEEVVLTEKIHGANSRFCFAEGRLWAGSRTATKRPDPRNMWWRVAAQYDLERRLRATPDLVVYGEVFGQVQDLKYGSRPGQLFLRLFDALDCKSRRYLDYDAFASLAGELGLDTAPVLHRGPWDPAALRPASNGPSTLPGAAHTREGFVVRPVRERHDLALGRVILKLVGEDYLLRKGG